MKPLRSIIGLLWLTLLMNLVFAPELSAQRRKALDLNKKALSYSGKGEYDKAIELYKEALSYEPGDSIIWGNLAWSYLGKEDYNSALQASNKAVELSSESAFARGIRARILVNLRRYEEAVKDFSVAIKSSDADEQRWHRFWRGEAYFRATRYEEAMSDFKYFLEKTPPQEKDNRYEASKRIALSYLGLGEDEKALEALKEIGRAHV